jgi:cyclopropane fatty-acyl-phospholipid synthase-like methyltransferase
VSIDAKFESSSAFFEAKYQAKADPWDFSHSAYELGRYDAIIGAISLQRYRRGFEPGCSIGVLTERLAGLCDAVDAIDFSPTASSQAQERCAHLPNVTVRCAALPDGIPADNFDLLVLSEIGYYFTTQVWRRISSALIDSISSGATVLAAHWLGSSQDHCISGDEVHEILLADIRLCLEYSERNQNMRLDRLVRL